MKNDEFGNRMKKYEAVSKSALMTRTPVIIRLDGKAFHTFLKGFKKPFDNIMVKSMQDTMKYLCENIQGCVLGYTQSDEITLVLVDYKNLNSSAWFDYEVQKMTSISASMATLAFNKAITKYIEEFKDDYHEAWNRTDEDTKLYDIYSKALEKGAMFDARVFNIPKEEVANCVLWRQKDAERNSILAVGQANFSHKELQNKSCKDILNMLEEKGIVWGNLPTTLKRGSCCIKDIKYLLDDGQRVKNNSHIIYKDKTGQFYFDGDGYYFYATGYKNNINCAFSAAGQKLEVKEISTWVIDNEIPRFVDEGRKYIEDLIYVGE